MSYGTSLLSYFIIVFINTSKLDTDYSTESWSTDEEFENMSDEDLRILVEDILEDELPTDLGDSTDEDIVEPPSKRLKRTLSRYPLCTSLSTTSICRDPSPPMQSIPIDGDVIPPMIPTSQALVDNLVDIPR